MTIVSIIPERGAYRILWTHDYNGRTWGPFVMHSSTQDVQAELAARAAQLEYDIDNPPQIEEAPE